MPQLNTNSARYFKPDYSPDAAARRFYKYCNILIAHSPDAAARRFYKYCNILIAPYFKLVPDATVGLNDPGPNSVQC
ncbi:Uncharacterised protein [Salmonella enterica subsp. enterica serovar Typhi]|nr:Uncharacterised protein [Salmonella enterica subsp. enterica serovar Typhi]CGE19302.1 Uncharacterised protein [Salmonella enterica subsp. enterica serovar Typhi]CGM84337.1 Uncharacterised protein [Salmonella enterica subsp. enterica serovar Typhi]CHQ10679.1 Uncharacterised protein [Salmonella enterica subsp. enterica serovar Typhi]CHV06040.1 Uncharacterised protein [Salmonella enterica subsp. enterica serovar Typhi]